MARARLARTGSDDSLRRRHHRIFRPGDVRRRHPHHRPSLALAPGGDDDVLHLRHLHRRRRGNAAQRPSLSRRAGGIADRQQAAVLRDVQPPGGAGRRLLHDLFRLFELPGRLQEPAHAVDDAAVELLCGHPAERPAGRDFHDRADGQRLEERLCRHRARRREEEKRCDDQWRAHLPDGISLPVSRLYGRAGGFCPDRVGAGGDGVHAGQPRLDDGAALQRNGHRGPAGGAVLPAGRRSHDVGERHRPHDHAVANAGRAFARRPGAGGDDLQHVLRRHFRLVRRRRRHPVANAGAGNEAGRLRSRLHGGADRLGLDHGQSDSAQHHGRGVWRDRQRVDRRVVSRRRGAWRVRRHRADDLQLLLRAGRHQASSAPRSARSRPPRSGRPCR